MYVKSGGRWRWALVSPDGVAPSRMVGVSTSVNLPLHHKVQKFSSGIVSPGWSRKKSRKTVVVVVGMCVCIRICVSRSSWQPRLSRRPIIDCRLYRTSQSLNVNRTETVTSVCRTVSVAMSSTVLDQSIRNFVDHSDVCKHLKELPPAGNQFYRVIIIY